LNGKNYKRFNFGGDPKTLKFLLTLLQMGHKMLGGGLHSPSAFLVIVSFCLHLYLTKWCRNAFTVWWDI